MLVPNHTPQGVVVKVKPPPLNVPAVPRLGMVRVAPTETAPVIEGGFPVSGVAGEKVKALRTMLTPPAGNTAVATALWIKPLHFGLGPLLLQFCVTEKVAALPALMFDNKIAPVTLRTPVGEMEMVQLAQPDRTINAPKLMTPFVTAMVVDVVAASTRPGCNTRKLTSRAASDVVFNSWDFISV